MGVTVPYYKYFNWNEYVNYNDGYSAICIDDVEGVIERYTGTNLTGGFPVKDASNFYTSAFEGTYFNKKVKLSNQITNCAQMFTSCYNFNQPIMIPNGVTNCASMFTGCRNNFNQPITIPNNVTDCSQMFYVCNKLDSTIVLGNRITNCMRMFSNCVSFNKPVVIPNGVTNCNLMFLGCTKFNQDITIPSSASDCKNMFLYANNFGSNIYINVVGRSETALNYLVFTNMLQGGNNLLRKNVYCNNLSLVNNPSAQSSIVGAQIGWTAITNGYYNATYNIYLYKNYTG